MINRFEYNQLSDLGKSEQSTNASVEWAATFWLLDEWGSGEGGSVDMKSLTAAVIPVGVKTRRLDDK